MYTLYFIGLFFVCISFIFFSMVALCFYNQNGKMDENDRIVSTTATIGLVVGISIIVAAKLASFFV